MLIMIKTYFDSIRAFNECQIGGMIHGQIPLDINNSELIRPILDGIRNDLKIAFSYFDKKFQEFDQSFQPRKGIYPIALKKIICSKQELIAEKEKMKIRREYEIKMRDETESAEDKKFRIEKEKLEEIRYQIGDDEPKFNYLTLNQISKLTRDKKLEYILRLSEFESYLKYYNGISDDYIYIYSDQLKNEMTEVDDRYKKLKEILLTRPDTFTYSRYEVMRWMDYHGYNPKIKFKTIGIEVADQEPEDKILFSDDVYPEYISVVCDIKCDNKIIANEKWPWGSYETKLLRHLEAAAREFWSTYNPDNTKASIPTSKEVIKWLENTHKVSNVMAKAIASLLRPDNLPTGPRKSIHLN